MKKHRINIQHPKARGEWAELRFMAHAAALGLRVSKPWGENSPYDFAVEHHGRFLRVQVKCTTKKRGNSWVCSTTSHRGPYTLAEIDFIAALIIPADTWYILPITALRRSSDVWLNPTRPSSRRAPYLEAWHLLTR